MDVSLKFNLAEDGIRVVI